jgi:hypothetical protein
MQISDHDKQHLQQIATLIEEGNLAEAKIQLARLQSFSTENAPLWYLKSFVADTQAEQFQV